MSTAIPWSRSPSAIVLAKRGTSSATRTLIRSPRQRHDRRGRQADLGLEPALLSGVKREVAAVRGGDRSDDREPEPVAVLRARAVGSEPPERLGELRDRALVENRTAALDHQTGRLTVGLAS